MKRRHILAGIAVCVTAAAAIGTFLVSATDSQVAPATNAEGANPFPGSILDGWANRDMDIGTLASARDDRPQQELPADGCDTGNSSGVAPGRQVANPFPGSILDGWANRDKDIGE